MTTITKFINNWQEYLVWNWWGGWWNGWWWTWYVTTSTLWQNWYYYYMYPWSKFNSDCFCKCLSIWTFCFDQYEPIIWNEWFYNNKSNSSPAWAFKTEPARCNEYRNESFITVSREKFESWVTVWKEVITSWLSAYIWRRDWLPAYWCFYANIWLVSPNWTCRCFYHDVVNSCWRSNTSDTTCLRWWLFNQYCSWNWLVSCEWDRLFIEIWWCRCMWWNNYSTLYLWLQNNQTYATDEIRQQLNGSWDIHSVWYLDANKLCAQAYPVQISMEK